MIAISKEPNNKFCKIIKTSTIFIMVFTAFAAVGLEGQFKKLKISYKTEAMHAIPINPKDTLMTILRRPEFMVNRKFDFFKKKKEKKNKLIEF